MIVWIALGLGIANVAVWTGVVYFAVSAWRRWKPSVVAALGLFLPPLP